MRRLVLTLTTVLALAGLASAPALAASKDRNHDRIPDRWERAHHLSLKVNQAKRDQDKDKLNNYGEWRAKTNPRKKDSDGDKINDNNEDRDRDNLRNASELVVKTDPRDPDSDDDGIDDGAEDYDDDGLSNEEEDDLDSDLDDRDSDSDGVGDGAESAGHVTSFSSGLLTVGLFSGQSITAAVTDNTDIRCASGKPRLRPATRRLGRADNPFPIDLDMMLLSGTVTAVDPQSQTLSVKVSGGENGGDTYSGQTLSFTLNEFVPLLGPDLDGDGLPTIEDVSIGLQVVLLLESPLDGQAPNIVLALGWLPTELGQLPPVLPEPIKIQGTVASIDAANGKVSVQVSDGELGGQIYAGQTLSLSLSKLAALAGPDNNHNGHPDLGDVAVGEQVFVLVESASGETAVPSTIILLAWRGEAGSGTGVLGQPYGQPCSSDQLQPGTLVRKARLEIEGGELVFTRLLLVLPPA